MKHKRHQKDRRDKSERYGLDDHRYYKEHSSSIRKEYTQKHYIMRDLSNNSGDENERKKLIICIVNIVPVFNFICRIIVQ